MKPSQEYLARLAADFAEALRLESLASPERLPMPLSFPEKGEPEIDSFSFSILTEETRRKRAQSIASKAKFSAEVGRGPAAAPQALQGKIQQKDLPPNFLCEACFGRLYPVRKFFREGRLPILLLHHNGLLKKSSSSRAPLARERSLDFVFGGRLEDELFARILGKIGLKWEDLHYQEYPACHFNPDPIESKEEDWQERAHNCLEHVEKRIRASKIERIILSGNAAVALLGIKEAQEKTQSMEIFPFPLVSKEAEKKEVDCVVLRSPLALLSLENQRKRKTKKEEREAILKEEREIKAKTLSSLERLLSPLLLKEKSQSKSF